MAFVGMVRELVEATPNYHFYISGGFIGSVVCEMGNLEIEHYFVIAILLI